VARFIPVRRARHICRKTPLRKAARQSKSGEIKRNGASIRIEIPWVIERSRNTALSNNVLAMCTRPCARRQPGNLAVGIAVLYASRGGARRR
jgi:hypothetical protein